MSPEVQEFAAPERDPGSRASVGSFIAMLQQEMHAKGRSLTWLANQMHVPRPTLQTWLTRGRVPAEGLDRLLAAAELGLTREDLARDYDVALTRWARKPSTRVSSVQQGRGGASAAAVELAADRYLELIESLEPGDTLVSVVSDGLPPEVGEALVTMAAPVRQRAVLAALERGARVRFVVPSVQQLEAWRKAIPPAQAEKIARVKASLSWWVAQVTAAAKGNDSACTLEPTDGPIFLLGQHIVAHITRDASGPIVAGGFAFSEARADECSVATLSEDLCRVLVEIIEAQLTK